MPIPYMVEESIEVTPSIYQHLGRIYFILEKVVEERKDPLSAFSHSSSLRLVYFFPFFPNLLVGVLTFRFRLHSWLLFFIFALHSPRLFSILYVLHIFLTFLWHVFSHHHFFSPDSVVRQVSMQVIVHDNLAANYIFWFSIRKVLLNTT